MYINYFQAQLLSSFFDASILIPAINAAVNAFNMLNRKNYKHLAVRLNSNTRCFDFTLVSSIKIDPINYLRSSQYFSKQLALQSGISHYIVAGRLLEQVN